MTASTARAERTPPLSVSANTTTVLNESRRVSTTSWRRVVPLANHTRATPAAGQTTPTLCGWTTMIRPRNEART